MNEYIEIFLNWLTVNGLKFIFALVILIVVFKIINVFSKKIEKRLIKQNIDKTLSITANNALRIALKIIVILVLCSYVGIETTGLGTIVASISLGIGLAVQGSLANFAGGVVILVMRPFKLGDYITAQGSSGTVEEIKLFYTYITTPDNKVIMIPNGTLANGNIINYSMKKTRRIEQTYSISYSEDFEKAKKVIMSVIATMPEILPEPAPFVRMSEHASSTINIVVRVWVNSADYWTVHYNMLEGVKREFDSHNIEIPFNQLDVHLDK